MSGAQVAVADYAPAGWPPATDTIIRRVRVEADQISTDARSRRRRTIDRHQLALVLDGVADHGWATSFIVTNLSTGGAGSTPPPTSRRDFGCVPTSKTASAKRSSGPARSTCSRAILRPTPCGCGLHCWPGTCPPCEPSPASRPANRATATGSATCCCECPPASSATPAASPYEPPGHDLLHKVMAELRALPAPSG